METSYILKEKHIVELLNVTHPDQQSMATGHVIGLDKCGRPSLTKDNPQVPRNKLVSNFNMVALIEREILEKQSITLTIHTQEMSWDIS